ncbi:MAG: 2OG-Fe(II) oxygenase, partial [Thalassolituus sp.]
ELAQSLSQKVLNAVKQNPLFISAALPQTYFYPRFNCYQNGGHYGLHTDSSILTNDDGQMMRSDVSATLFLSDANEYEGGELTIETPFGAQE